MKAEDALQVAIVTYLRTILPARAYRVAAIPNGGFRDAREAAKMKATGTLAGMPDLIVFGDCGRCWFIELKTATGRLSPAQSDMREWMMLNGVPYVVARSIDDVKSALVQWGPEDTGGGERMNPELQRQNDAAKARRLRIDSGSPACRAMQADIVRDRTGLRPKMFRRFSAPAVKAPPVLALGEAIEREHRVRCRCVREAYEAEMARHRSAFVATTEECRKRELEDLAELTRYRLDLLREAGVLS